MVASFLIVAEADEFESNLCSKQLSSANAAFICAASRLEGLLK